MKIQVVTLFPDVLRQSLSYGVIGQALKEEKWALETINPREFTNDNHHTVDDRVFGGSDGMLMLAEPLALAVEKLKESATVSATAVSEKSVQSLPSPRVVHLSPRGRKFTDSVAREWAREWLTDQRSLLLVATRYAGADARFIESFCDDEISIGDFVVSGGDGPAALVIDAVLRHLPGILGNEKSAMNDSFSDLIFESAQYTRPRQWRNVDVPNILLGGDPALISDWQFLEALHKTIVRRPDIVREAQEDFRKKLEARLLEISQRVERETRMRVGRSDQNARSLALIDLQTQLNVTKEAWENLKSSGFGIVRGKA